MDHLREEGGGQFAIDTNLLLALSCTRDCFLMSHVYEWYFQFFLHVREAVVVSINAFVWYNYMFAFSESSPNSQMAPSQQSNGASLLGPRVLGFRFNQSLSYRKGKFPSLKTETLMIQCLFVWICSYISFESHSNEEQMLRIVNNRIWLLTFFKMIFNCFCYSISWKGELIARSFRSKTARKFVRKMLAQ